MLVDIDPISTSTFYHPDCLADHHDGRFEKHTGIHLYQKDIRDVKGQLVEPWRMQAVYKPGTLLLAVCTFKMWCQEKSDNTEPNHVCLSLLSIPRPNDDPSRVQVL